MTEIFQPKKFWCQKGEAFTDDILSNGQIGFALNVCGACAYYTQFELDSHTTATPADAFSFNARLGQVIQQTTTGPVVAECSPLNGEVRKEIDPVHIMLTYPKVPKLI